ncbi:MAG TPA: hypothetical protein VEJ20_00300, partial [Candidatus Eremiobacteraceae bacterium]|nr:hypothetical protein [Candidatus Eremiobacteraceae bacterium]
MLAASLGMANPAPTKVETYKPFSGHQLAAGLVVSSRVRGSCWEGSMADYARSDAWRCMSGNDIYDPCFSGKLNGSLAVVCGDPWSNRVVVMSLSAALPAANAPEAGADPWALELGDGARCALITGATGEVDGMRLNYGCTENESAYGSPHRSNGAWTIAVGVGTSTHLRQVSVRVAW